MSDSSAESKSNSNASNKNDKPSLPAIGKRKGMTGGAMIKCKTFMFKPKGNAIVNFAYNLMMDEEMMKEAEEAFEERERERERDSKENEDEPKTKEKRSSDESLVFYSNQQQATTKRNLECIKEEDISSQSTFSPSVQDHNLKIFNDADGKKVYHFSPNVVIKTFKGPDGKLKFEETTPGAVEYIRNLKDFKSHLMKAEAEADERERDAKGKEPEVSFRDEDAEKEKDRKEMKVKSGAAIDFNQFKRVRRSSP